MNPTHLNMNVSNSPTMNIVPTGGSSTLNMNVPNSPTMNLVPTGGSSTGGGDKAYVYIQSSAANVWVITHNLNKYPSVTVVDSAGSVVVGEVVYNNANKVTITFIGSFSGKAYLN